MYIAIQRLGVEYCHLKCWYILHLNYCPYCTVILINCTIRLIVFWRCCYILYYRWTRRLHGTSDWGQCSHVDWNYRPVALQQLLEDLQSKKSSSQQSGLGWKVVRVLLHDDSRCIRISAVFLRLHFSQNTIGLCVIRARYKTLKQLCLTLWLKPWPSVWIMYDQRPWTDIDLILESTLLICWQVNLKLCCLSLWNCCDHSSLGANFQKAASFWVCSTQKSGKGLICAYDRDVSLGHY